MKTDEILEAIIKCCKDHGAGQVILFGSRAKGTCLDTSDFDIGVTEGRAGGTSDPVQN